MGDLLLTVNGRSLQSPAEIANLGQEASLSATLVLGVSRGGKPLELRLER
jgi:S1-C subfamily serine protease